MARLNYVELPVGDVGTASAFYAEALGWTLSPFGSSYAATTTGDTDLGLQGDAAEAPAAPLPVIQVADLETTIAAVERAGGTISRPVFAFPGGRRFHFRDSAGNELAAMTPDAG